MSIITSSDLEINRHKEEYEINKVKESETLLYQLDYGKYSMVWKGIYPFQNSQLKNNNHINSIDITVEPILDLGGFFKFKNPFKKNVKISGQDISCIKSWTYNQLVELNSNIVLVLNGICSGL